MLVVVAQQRLSGKRIPRRVAKQAPGLLMASSHARLLSSACSCSRRACRTARPLLPCPCSEEVKARENAYRKSQVGSSAAGWLMYCTGVVLQCSTPGGAECSQRSAVFSASRSAAGCPTAGRPCCCTEGLTHPCHAPPFPPHLPAADGRGDHWGQPSRAAHARRARDPGQRRERRVLLLLGNQLTPYGCCCGGRWGCLACMHRCGLSLPPHCARGWVVGHMHGGLSS